MGFFNHVKSGFKKAEASGVIHRLFAERPWFMHFEMDPAATSDKLVDAVWAINPDLFDGKLGSRPHKLAVVACALAHGVEALDVHDRHVDTFCFLLGNVLVELEAHGERYPLSAHDFQLLGAALRVYARVSEQRAESPLGKEVAELYARGEAEAAKESQ